MSARQKDENGTTDHVGGEILPPIFLQQHRTLDDAMDDLPSFQIMPLGWAFIFIIVLGIAYIVFA